MARPKKTDKDEIISLSYCFTESDRQFITFYLKNFDPIFVNEFYEFRKEFSDKQYFLIEECFWVFREFADYLNDNKYFSKNERDDLDNVQYHQLKPLFQVLKARFCIFFKYYKLIYGNYNPAITYPIMELRSIIIRSFYYELLPGSKDAVWCFFRESIKVANNGIDESDTKFYKNLRKLPPDGIDYILAKLKKSDNPAYRKDYDTFHIIMQKFLRTTERRPYAEYYQHLAKGDDIKQPKAGRKYTHQERCPNCSTLMVIETHHDTYQERTNYLKCNKCGCKKTLKNKFR